DTITVVGLGVTGKSFFVYAQKFSAGLCIFPLQSSALLFCHTHLPSFSLYFILSCHDINDENINFLFKIYTLFCLEALVFLQSLYRIVL
ncbi:hypothetical protein, partial [Caldibacillus thermoamylovorans]|uniref:hypothetical protein n=1 Tax=Caldibacillus thermoamylovorans TaxID=35841 RepID=UPI00203AA6F4